MTSSVIKPGLFRLKVPMPDKDMFLGHTNCYLFEGEHGFTLLDTGWGGQQGLTYLQNELKDLNIEFNKIELVINTHNHYDHYGLSGKIKEASKARIAIHRNDARRWQIQDENALTLMLDRHGVPRAEDETNQTVSSTRYFYEVVEPDWLLDGHENISCGDYKLQVMHTPGHSPGEICVYEQTQKLLFTGDHVLPTISSHIGIREGEVNPLGDFLNSLKLFGRMEIALVLPGHGEPFTNLHGRIKELEGHHAERLAEIMENMVRAPRTAYDIASRITWLKDSTAGVPFKKLSFRNQRLALTETLAHLEYLKCEGKVSRADGDGFIYYQLV